MSERIDEYALQDLTTSDKLFGVDSGGDTRQYTPGTAASSDVQTSATDTTADRLMAVGAFGLGNDDTTSPTPADLDDITVTGFYGADSGTVNKPLSNTGNWVVHHFTRAANIYVQIAYSRASMSTQGIYVRVYNSSWGTWEEILQTGRYPSDSAWTTTTSLDNGWTGTVRYIKRAGWVTVNIEGVDGTSKTDNVFLTLPSNYRPTTAIIQGTLFDVVVNETERLIVDITGNVQSGGATALLRGSVTYPVL